MASVRGSAGSLDRGEVTSAIAEYLGIDPPLVGVGSTVPTEFLGRVLEAMGVDPSDYGSSYRKLEVALSAVGEVYDPALDSSESRGRTGGGTITNTGYRKLLRGLTGTPRCFILSLADSPASERYRDITGESYGFDTSVSGRNALLEAGPGSLVVFHRTGKAFAEPKKAFVAKAHVVSIEEVAPGRFRAHLAGYREFEIVVPDSDTDIAGWNRQHGIVEIGHETFLALESVGGGRSVSPTVAVTSSSVPSSTSSGSSRTFSKVVSDEDADGVLAKAGPVDGPLHPGASVDVLPETLPLPTGAPSTDRLTPLPGDDEMRRGSGRASGPGQRRIDKFIEKRAIHLTKAFMEANEWRLQRDCQALGVGFDLEFEKGGIVRHVEVKGVGGPRLAFNMTALEWRRVLEDKDFLVIAVTSVLDPSSTHIHVLTRDALQDAERSPLQYRLNIRLP